MRQGIFVTTIGLALAATAIGATATPGRIGSTQASPTPAPTMNITPAPTPSGMAPAHVAAAPPSIGPSTGPTNVPSPQGPSPSPAATSS